SGGIARVLLPEVPYEIEGGSWSNDSKSVQFTASMGTHNELMKVDIATKRVSQLTKGDHSIGGWSYSEDNALHVFTLNTGDRPSEIYTLPAAGGTPKRVTSVFDEDLAKFKTSRQERITWKGADGATIEGLLNYPVDYVQGRRYPLIVMTHGGPAEADRSGFAIQVQVYAAKGYAVLRPNYRGSTGYGDKFLRDMVNGYFK